LEPSLKQLEAEMLHDEIIENWNEVANTSDNAIFKALMRTYKKPFIYAMLVNLFQVGVDIATPFMLFAIINFMQSTPEEGGRGVGYGIFLISLYLVLDLIAKILSQQGNYLQGILGAKAYTGVVAICYNKVLRCSSATNKSFSQAEIINFIQVDAMKIFFLAWVFPIVARLPIQLIFSLSYLIYFLGYSIFGAFGIAFVLVFINFFLAIIGQKVQKVVLKRKDERMRFTTEFINNIKIIKLNSWIPYFV
jgi:ATP-binding cassette subfamily C (CFTR/MRP) protein 1